MPYCHVLNSKLIFWIIPDIEVKFHNVWFLNVNNQVYSVAIAVWMYFMYDFYILWMYDLNLCAKFILLLFLLFIWYTPMLIIWSFYFLVSLKKKKRNTKIWLLFNKNKIMYD